MTRNRPSLTFANMTSVLALVVALGGTSYAATQLPKNSVGTKQIQNGQVKSPDLASNAVGTTKVGADALTGDDIREGTLAGVDAARVGGVTFKKISYQAPLGTGFQTVVNFPGEFRIDAQCQGGDLLDVFAYSGEAHSAISQSAIWTQRPDDTDTRQDLSGSSNSDLGPGTPFAVDLLGQSTFAGTLHSIEMHTPSGFVVHVELRLAYSGLSAGGGCNLSGIAIGG